MKKMKIIIRAWGIAMYETKVILFSVKFLVISVLSWMFIDIGLMDIRKFALDYGLKMIPAMLPFYFSDIIFGNIAFLLLVFLFSSIPLKNSGQKQLMSRCGVSCLAIGQMVSVVCIALLFVLEQFVFSILSTLSCIEFSGWGKVWGSVASGRMMALGYDAAIGVSEKVLAAYTPWRAVFISMFLFFLTGVCYGLLEWLLNGISNGKAGTAALSAWSLSWIFLQSMGNKWIKVLDRFSPQRWNDLSGKIPSEIIGTISILMVVILILFFFGKAAVKAGKIEML